MAGKAKGLGRGLDTLIPASSSKPVKKEVVESVEKGPETLVKITKVEPNREQPRKNFDEDALLELAESIKQFGLLQPILVQDRKDYYEIIAGERRWRAAKLAGLKEVPVIIKNLTEQEIVDILNMLENEWEKDDYVAVVAPDEVQGKVRGYNPAIYTVYGRDLWEQELLPYFYDGYEEWQYSLHGYMNSKLFDIIEGEEVNAPVYRNHMLELVQNSGATHVVLKKTNVIPELIMDEEKEKSVESMEYNGMELRLIDKTDNYFLYRVFR